MAYPYAGINRIRFKGSTDRSVSQVKPPLRTRALFQKAAANGNFAFTLPPSPGRRAALPAALQFRSRRAKLQPGPQS